RRASTPQLPTPNAQRPTPNAQGPTPNAQCPKPPTQEGYWALGIGSWELGIDMRASQLQGEHIVESLAPPDQPRRSSLDENFRRQHAAVVVRGHHRAIGAGVEDGVELAHPRVRQHAIPAQRVAALAE